MQILWQDLRYGARMLLKKPGFTLISIITLALAIGANTAIFSVVDAVLLQPLPYPDSDRLMRIWEVYRQEKSTASFPCLTDMRKQSRSFAQIAAYEYERLILTGSDRPEYVTGMKVSADFFQTLSLKPALGRDFQAEDDRYGASHVVIIGHGLWQRRFSGNQRAIGREMTINNETYVVVGVLPPGVEYPDPHVEIWAPLALEPKRSVDRGNHFLNVIGRLNTDVSTQVAQSDMNAVARRMEEEYPNNNKGVGVLIMPLNEELVGEVRRALLVLLGAVGFVLLIACANVATLLLARAAGRQKELAIRAALGANRRMMIRQLMMESLLLSLFGGGMGLLLALWLVDLLAPAIPGGIHNAKAVDLN
ncbi:MAG: ABC transporter permease, partial [Blastocatellia bacterium]|nr:ABC transporter permease [Blastocatellia bacterium]